MTTSQKGCNTANTIDEEAVCTHHMLNMLNTASSSFLSLTPL